MAVPSTPCRRCAAIARSELTAMGYLEVVHGYTRVYTGIQRAPDDGCRRTRLLISCRKGNPDEAGYVCIYQYIGKKKGLK